MSQCNGDGSHHACVTQTLCVPTAPCPPAYTANGAPSCSGDQLCLGTTIYTRCAKETASAEVSRRTITRPPRVEATPTPVPVPEPETTSHDEPLPISDLAADPNQVSDSNQSSTSLDLLFARQNGCGGSANGGCDYIPFCALCVTVEKVPCVKARLSAVTGPLSGTDIEVSIIEDGNLVCLVKLHCSIWDTDCSGLEDADCGDNYSLGFKWNYVNYYSPKYDQNFPLYLDREEKNNLIFCTQKFGLIEAPSGCLEDVFSIENGPCRSKKRDLPILDGFEDVVEGLWGATSGEDNMTALAISSEHNVLSPRAFTDFSSANCNNAQMMQLTAWVADVSVMTRAAVDALTDLEDATTPHAVLPYPPQIGHIARTLSDLLGVNYSSPNHADLQTLRGYYWLVGNYSLGIFPHREAWIFCGDSFTEAKQWTDITLDINDQQIINNNQPLQLQQVAAYKPFQRRGYQPYRIPAMKKYTFSTPGRLDPGRRGTRVGAICSNGNQNPVAVTIHLALGFPVITICSPMNRGGFDGFTVLQHDTISQVPLQPNVGLDNHRPRSGTLLHEFMHAARGAGAAPDRAGNSQSCSRVSRMNPTDAMNSPECATLFAVAMYFQRSTASTPNPYQFSFLRAQPV
ncbi:hypothetical protein F4679DRAFT_564663 [Xylaria curta]|nr:hypothetical protein F4679DRAFT_564663 [Xylaria curta]